MRDNEREQRVMQAMTRHRDRERLADTIAATINQANAEEADALAALAIVMQRITAVQIGISYADWQAYYTDGATIRTMAKVVDPPAANPSPYAAAMAAELAE